MFGDFDRSIVECTAHRPWPMPSAPWLMTQSWTDPLFAHWRIDEHELQRLVPAAFELDLFDGEAWLAVVPFHMSNVGPRATPALPWLSAFPELDVRTYVRVGDRPGCANYEPDGPALIPAVGSLEYFLTERYGLYHVDRRGRPYRLEIHHPPWSLQAARAAITVNTMAAASGLSFAGAPALLHFARRQDVIAWAPSRLA